MLMLMLMLMLLMMMMVVVVVEILIGSLSNYDDDHNDDFKKAIGLMIKTTALHVHHVF